MKGEREAESETKEKKKERQRGNKTEKVTVSGRRVFTPTNYDSRCRYAPFRKTLVRHNGEKLAQRIANRSSVHRGWKNRAETFHEERVEYGPLKANPRRLLARRNGGTDSRLTFARSPLPHRVSANGY